MVTKDKNVETWMTVGAPTWPGFALQTERLCETPENLEQNLDQNLEIPEMSELGKLSIIFRGCQNVCFRGTYRSCEDGWSSDEVRRRGIDMNRF